MRVPEQLSLEQAIERVAGGIARHEAVSVFLEALRVAAAADAMPEAASALLGEEGTLAYAKPATPEALDAAGRVRAACRLATRLFGAAQLEPPLALGTASETAPERFPTLRHLRDAFELELLLSGTPPPTDIERRMAIAALMAKAREFRLPVAAPPARPAVQPPPPRAAPEESLPVAIDPSAEITEPSMPAQKPVPARWLMVAGFAAIALVVAALLMRAQPPPVAAPAPAAAAIAPEIALPPPEMSPSRPPPAVADARRVERAAPLPAAEASVRPEYPPRPAEAAPRALRNLRRRSAVADARAPARAKLQLGDASLKQGRFFEAVIAFREALENEPPLAVAARRLGDAYRAHQDDDLAVSAYERYLELEPSAPDADEVRAAVEELRSGTPLAR